MTAARWIVEESSGSCVVVRTLPNAESLDRRYITESAESTEGAAMTPPKPVLTEADHNAIAALVLEGLKVAPIPLHEMSDAERDAYANEVWARAGVIANRPNAGKSISGNAK